MQKVIELQNVSKRYQIGKIGSRYFFREIHSMFRRISNTLSSKLTTSEYRKNYIMALQSVSLDVHQGETIGVIGRNGSGKSTLLKLLAGITLPSTGTIDITGRVASLLGIGAGFEDDLSARENIFLNGAILGMRRKELLQQFDSIVSFSGISRFIDTPVKRFSSGMYTRLAFSIALHCFADIMLIDEILSVADLEFLGQCRERLQSYATAGKTILIVSHNLKTISTLCPRSLLLADGCIIADGKTEEVLKLYTTSRSTAACPRPS